MQHTARPFFCEEGRFLCLSFAQQEERLRF